MKSPLLPSALILGTILFPQVAIAEISLITGGRFEFAVGVFDHDASDSIRWDFETQAEVFVRADGKINNSLDYGAEIKMNNNSSNAMSVDEAFLHISGSWGRIEGGDNDGAANDMAVYAPVIGYGQVDTDRSTPNYTDFLGNAPVSTRVIDNGDSTKITYYTPKFSGLQAGISYTPEQNEGQSIADGSEAYKNWWEGAINYSHRFDAVEVLLGAGFTTADARSTTTKNFTGFNMGAQIRWGGLALGGAYTSNGNYLVPKSAEDNTARSINFGLSYEVDSLTVAASFLTAENGIADNIAFSNYTAYGTGAVYKLAPGLSVQGDFMFADAETAAGEKSHGWTLMIGSKLVF